MNAKYELIDDPKAPNGLKRIRAIWDILGRLIRVHEDINELVA